MVAQKLDYKEVKRLADSGLKQIEIAERFGVQKGTVSKCLKKMNHSVGIITATDRAAPAYISALDDEIVELKSLLEKANDQLNWIAETIEKKTDSEYRQWDDSYRRMLAECRKLIKEISQTKFKAFKSIQVVELFNAIDEAISHETIETQKRIAKRIKRKLGAGIPRGIN